MSETKTEIKKPYLNLKIELKIFGKGSGYDVLTTSWDSGGYSDDLPIR
jgi:hypothetical protein